MVNYFFGRYFDSVYYFVWISIFFEVIILFLENYVKYIYTCVLIFMYNIFVIILFIIWKYEERK